MWHLVFLSSSVEQVTDSKSSLVHRWNGRFSREEIKHWDRPGISYRFKHQWCSDLFRLCWLICNIHIAAGHFHTKLIRICSVYIPLSSESTPKICSLVSLTRSSYFGQPRRCLRAAWKTLSFSPHSSLTFLQQRCFYFASAGENAFANMPCWSDGKRGAS